MIRLPSVLVFGLALGLIGCTRDEPLVLQGYVEADYIYAAAPQGGWLSQIHVREGAEVKIGDPLFTLDADAQVAVLEQAEAQVTQAEAALANLKKGRRPDEIAAIAAGLSQAKANAGFAAQDHARIAALSRKGFATQKQLQAARAANEAARARVLEIEANLATARLGARADEVRAGEAAVSAALARRAEADYALRQRALRARAAGRVEDRLREAGEFVPAQGPVLKLLPPGNLKIRFFVPEGQRALFKTGARISVRCTSCGTALAARVSFVATQAEFTPPVIYSTDARAKLVWMTEARFDAPATLSPGQPVDISLVPAS